MKDLILNRNDQAVSVCLVCAINTVSEMCELTNLVCLQFDRVQ